jgi:adenylate kinase family enzyme
MRRVAIVGTTGSGKSTLAERLAPLIGAPHVELDALFWLPGWDHQPFDEFWHLVQQATAQRSWIVVGNYTIVRDLVWARADTLLWLDYPLPLTFLRLLRRTLRRIRTREELWGTGNRESWRKSFADRESILLWALKTWRKNRESFEKGLAMPAYAHLTSHRFRRPAETERWVSELAAGQRAVHDACIGARPA